jgi:hypothetical protein
MSTPFALGLGVVRQAKQAAALCGSDVCVVCLDGNGKAGNSCLANSKIGIEIMQGDPILAIIIVALVIYAARCIRQQQRRLP